MKSFALFSGLRGVRAGMRNHWRKSIVLSTIIGIILISGCATMGDSAGLSTADKAAQLKPGMKDEQVEALLGKPESSKTVKGQLVVRWNPHVSMWMRFRCTSPSAVVASPILLAVIDFLRFSRWGALPRRARGGIAMKWHCKECGRLSLRLNKEEECPDCASKNEELKSYFTKLQCIAPSCAKLIPAT